MLILIADDDELILRTVEHKLVNEGHDVILARNGKEAIEKIKELPVELLITDIMMPFVSGIEILSAIQSFEKKIPVIVLSSLGQEDVIIDAFDLGADDFMVKPFSPNELIIRVKRLIKR